MSVIFCMVTLLALFLFLSGLSLAGAVLSPVFAYNFMPVYSTVAVLIRNPYVNDRTILMGYTDTTSPEMLVLHDDGHQLAISTTFSLPTGGVGYDMSRLDSSHALFALGWTGVVTVNHSDLDNIQVASYADWTSCQATGVSARDDYTVFQSLYNCGVQLADYSDPAFPIKQGSRAGLGYTWKPIPWVDASVNKVLVPGSDGLISVDFTDPSALSVLHNTAPNPAWTNSVAGQYKVPDASGDIYVYVYRNKDVTEGQESPMVSIWKYAANSESWSNVGVYDFGGEIIWRAGLVYIAGRPHIYGSTGLKIFLSEIDQTPESPQLVKVLSMPDCAYTSWWDLTMSADEATMYAFCRSRSGGVQVLKFDCHANCTDRDCGNDGCGGLSCGVCSGQDVCDKAGQCVCQPVCSGKVCGDDGCGGSCGSCLGSDICVQGTCQCAQYTGCQERVCGYDGCGVSCGTCKNGDTCSEHGLCFCTANCTGKMCGSDGCGGMCGCCAGDYSCSATGQCQAIACVPDCDQKQCGCDGCGGLCGSCQAGGVCNATGQCDCTPDCQGKACGDDGCGGTCGSCLQERVCSTQGQCVCVPTCDDGNECGPDSCGGYCGRCDSGIYNSCFDMGAGVHTCKCVPDCRGRQCGPDGCGGRCFGDQYSGPNDCADGKVCRISSDGVSGKVATTCVEKASDVPSGTSQQLFIGAVTTCFALLLINICLCVKKSGRSRGRGREQEMEQVFAAADPPPQVGIHPPVYTVSPLQVARL